MPECLLIPAVIWLGRSFRCSEPIPSQVVGHICKPKRTRRFAKSSHQVASDQGTCDNHFWAIRARRLKLNLRGNIAIPRQAHPKPRKMKNKGVTVSMIITKPAISKRFESTTTTSACAEEFMRPLQEVTMLCYQRRYLDATVATPRFC